MTRDDIIRMARDSGMELYGLGKDREKFVHYLQKFAALVAAAERDRIIEKNAPVIDQINAHMKALEAAVAAEREACADICDQHATCEGTAQLCAEAIRARGNDAQA